MHHKLLHIYLTDEQRNQQQPTEHLELTFKNDMYPDPGIKCIINKEQRWRIKANLNKINLLTEVFT